MEHCTECGRMTSMSAQEAHNETEKNRGEFQKKIQNHTRKFFLPYVYDAIAKITKCGKTSAILDFTNHMNGFCENAMLGIGAWYITYEETVRDLRENGYQVLTSKTKDKISVVW